MALPIEAVLSRPGGGWLREGLWLSRPLQDIAHRAGIPSPAACRGDIAAVELSRNLGQGLALLAQVVDQRFDGGVKLPGARFQGRDSLP